MSENISTKELQYNFLLDRARAKGLTPLGLMVNGGWAEDPRRLVFTLSRYKFVSKMLAGRKSVLEVGCADAFGTRIVQQTTQKLTAIDFDPIFIDDVKSRMEAEWPFEAFVHDVLSGPVPGRYDAVYALDVLEHILPENEHLFLQNAFEPLDEHGVAIFGMPSIESQLYASKVSREGHVNCKTGEDLKALFETYFHTVLAFSMNDEVVHTGFFRMANYIIVIGCGRKVG